MQLPPQRQHSSKWDFPPSTPQTMKAKVKDPGGSEGTEWSLGQEDSPGEGNSYPLQYSCLENPMEKGAWRVLQSIGSQRFGHDWATNTWTFLPMLPLAPLPKLYFPPNPEISVVITAFHRCKNKPRGGEKLSQSHGGNNKLGRQSQTPDSACSHTSVINKEWPDHSKRCDSREGRWRRGGSWRNPLFYANGRGVCSTLTQPGATVSFWTARVRTTFVITINLQGLPQGWGY